MVVRRSVTSPLLRLRGGLQAAANAPELLSQVNAAPAAQSSPVREWMDNNWQQLAATGAVLLLLLPILPKLPRKASVTAVAIAVALVQMAFDAPPEQALLETVVVLVAANVISLKDALDGFRSEGVVAVGVMTAVAKSVQTTGGLNLLAGLLLGKPSGRFAAVVRMLLPVLAISAFLNNTPVCAMMMPILAEWAASLGVPIKQLLMPLSFATMLGGTLSLIGSSTNLVAAGAAQKYDPSFAMGIFDISKVGLINALAGCAYMLLAGPTLLPDGNVPVLKQTASDATASPPPPRGIVRLWLTLGLLAGTMTIAAQQPKRLVHVALIVLCVMMRLGCLTLKEAWSAINGPVLLSIALSFALGVAIEKSDLATIVAAKIVDLVAPFGTLALLFAIYTVAILVGAVISNNAVVVLMFPLVVRVCEGAGIPWKAAFYALTMAASASFSTPVSYQTNLMVAGAGNYAFADFVRFGLPLQLVCMLATVPACYLLYK